MGDTQRFNSTGTRRALRAVLTSLAVVGIAGLASGESSWPSHVSALKVDPGGSVAVVGELSGGKKIDLAWATKSNVACFPATENVNFTGNHVFYAMQLPKYAQVTITATPKNATTDVSLYAYSIGTTDFRQIPPDVTRTACEASYDAQKDSNPGKPESVKIVSMNNPYNVVIGVAGANGLTKGQFDLKVDLISTKSTGSMTPLVATPIAPKSNEAIVIKGDLGKGTSVDLAWASNSSTACFPSTQNANFLGNHMLYRTSIPKKSEMIITATPDDPKLDISLYAYEVGSTDTTSVPPTLARCVSCEASYDARKQSNPGQSESVKLTAINNPYNVFIGVAGPKGVTAGSYTLKIETKTR